MSLLTPIYVSTWYISNITIIILNKLLISYYGFHYPILLTMCHMICAGLLTSVVGSLGVYEIDQIKSLRQMYKVAFLSIIFMGSILCGNLALMFVEVSFYQSVAATTPFFVAVLAAILQGRIERMPTYSTLVPVAFGTITSSSGEPNLNLIGLCLCLGATFARGLKTVVQSMLLSSDDQKLNSQSLLKYMAPFAVMMLVPLVLIYEPDAAHITLQKLANSRQFVGLFMLNVLSAYFVNLFNFLVTKQLGALSIQVLGNIIGVVGAVVSVGVFWNPVTPMGVIGYGMTITGVFLYLVAKQHFVTMDSTIKIVENVLPYSSEQDLRSLL
eukprot:TRINITY_DN2257_c0_g1_i5.p1 TRINITY_DN2257_c0_g1~~TRINITY_DN2257_c0_g1_i5.p1  ORF type:complete len:327 (-),score=21.66 TRINITY_DN2257_c0_g1_i5:698-1678(-)